MPVTGFAIPIKRPRMILLVTGKLNVVSLVKYSDLAVMFARRSAMSARWVMAFARRKFNLKSNNASMLSRSIAGKLNP